MTAGDPAGSPIFTTHNPILSPAGEVVYRGRADGGGEESDGQQQPGLAIGGELDCSEVAESSSVDITHLTSQV